MVNACIEVNLQWRFVSSLQQKLSFLKMKHTEVHIYSKQSCLKTGIILAKRITYPFYCIWTISDSEFFQLLILMWGFGRKFLKVCTIWMLSIRAFCRFSDCLPYGLTIEGRTNAFILAMFFMSSANARTIFSCPTTPVSTVVTIGGTAEVVVQFEFKSSLLDVA